MSIFSPHLLLQYLLNWDFFDGALMTLWISVASLLAGMLIGLLLAAGQEAPWRPVRLAILGYLWLFRGTPVLLQLVFAFNVLPAFGLVFPAYVCAVLALGLNEGAYMTEIMRSGILAVGRGQRQAARALAMQPALMLYDEPTSALDPETVGEVLEVMQELAGEGMTSIVVTHEMGFARRAADRVIFLEGGRVAHSGPADEFFSEGVPDRVGRFLGRLRA